MNTGQIRNDEEEDWSNPKSRSNHEDHGLEPNNINTPDNKGNIDLINNVGMIKDKLGTRKLMMMMMTRDQPSPSRMDVKGKRF